MRAEAPLHTSPPAPVRDEVVSVFLLNMGGPRGAEEVLPFLRRLFRDRRLMRFPGPARWQPVWAEVLVALRGRAAKRRYGLIGGGSPIAEATRRQAAALREELGRRGCNLDVRVCFNYSHPFPQEALTEARRLGRGVIIPLSLYPHYSSATTGASLQALFEAARRCFPEAVFLEPPGYHLSEGYVRAFVDRIRECLQGDPLEDFLVVFSAHGLPRRRLLEGDPYPFLVRQTAVRIIEVLGRRGPWRLAYQSAVGPVRWLEPSTEEVVRAAAEAGWRRMIVVPISFVSDHIETLCEIAIEYRDLARRRGVSDFRMIRALECHPAFIGALADAVERALSSGLPSSTPPWGGGMKGAPPVDHLRGFC